MTMRVSIGPMCEPIQLHVVCV